MTSLGELLAIRRELEDRLEESEGIIEAELEAIWDDNEKTIAQKVDQYVFVIKHLESIGQMAKEREQHLKTLRERSERETKRIKTRLFHHSQGKKLHGEEYYIIPRTTFRSEVNMNMVGSKYQIITLEMPLDTWTSLLAGYTVAQESPQCPHVNMSDIVEKGRRVRVTDLPKDHPAIMREENNWVLIK